MAAESAAQDVACLSALYDNYDNVLQEVSTASPIIPLPVWEVSNSQGVQEPLIVSLQSEIMDDDGKLSIDHMLQMRCRLQSGTTTKSNHTVWMDPKFALWCVTDIISPTEVDGKHKMTYQEASQCTHVVQALARDNVKEMKAWEIRWGLQDIVTTQGESIHS